MEKDELMDVTNWSEIWIGFPAAALSHARGVSVWPVKSRQMPIKVAQKGIC